MRYKANWENTKERFNGFWNREDIGRCNLAISVRNPKDALRLPRDDYTVEEQYTDPDYVFRRWDWRARNTAYLAEGIPAFYLNYGTAGHAAYFGGKPKYAQDTIWFDPVIDEPDPGLILYDATERVFNRHKAFAEEIAARSKGLFLTAMTDNSGIIDALAALRGTDNLLIDMLENPDFVEQASVKLTEVWKNTQAQFLDILADNNEGGSSHGWMQTWSAKRQGQLQCDFSVMISPALFERFVLPELYACAGFYDRCAYHVDGIEQIRHLDMILSVRDITAIQWTPVAGQPRTSTHIQIFHRIQKAGKCLILLPEPDEVPYLLENLSHRGLHLVVNGVRTIEEAEALIGMAERSNR